MAADHTIEERIRERAHQLWEEEGRPQGRAEAHWERARVIVALEDAHQTTLQPIPAPDAEPVEVIQNLGEFPTLTDQGEERTYPNSRSEIVADSFCESPDLPDDISSEVERFSGNPDDRDMTRIAQFASELTLAYSLFFFLTAAAAGLALSVFLKIWLSAAAEGSCKVISDRK